MDMELINEVSKATNVWWCYKAVESLRKGDTQAATAKELNINKRTFERFIKKMKDNNVRITP